MDTFALLLVLAVPLLYGLFWWLDYRWLDTQSEVAREPEEPDPDDAW